MDYLMILEEELSSVQEKDNLGLQVGNTEVCLELELFPLQLILVSRHLVKSVA